MSPSNAAGGGHFVLLMRHGRDLDGAGFGDACAVGRRLAETLEGLRATGIPGDEIRLASVLHAPSGQAERTATALGRQLPADIEMVRAPELHPKRASTYSGRRLKDELDGAITAVSAELEARKDHNAVLVLGHQPTMSRIAAKISRTPVPLAHAEIACLEGTDTGLTTRTWKLRWTIAPSDPDTDAALRAKLASKMQVAGVLGAVVAAALVFLLQNLFEDREPKGNMPQVLRCVSALSLFLATSLYLTTLYFYDRLMMPPRFWDEGGTGALPPWAVRRPPSSATWVVYQNMTRIWSWFFMPACGFLLLGFLLLGVSLFEPTSALHLLWLMAALLGGCVVQAVFVWVGRPRLSVDD